MESMNHDNWDAERYRELNIYFKIIIEQMLRTDQNLQEKMQQNPNFELSELVAHFSGDDQERWQEFIELDKMKLQIDMWDHLNGKGTRFKPGEGFVNPEDDTMW